MVLHKVVVVTIATLFFVTDFAQLKAHEPSPTTSITSEQFTQLILARIARNLPFELALKKPSGGFLSKHFPSLTKDQNYGLTFHAYKETLPETPFQTTPFQDYYDEQMVETDTFCKPLSLIGYVSQSQAQKIVEAMQFTDREYCILYPQNAKCNGGFCPLAVNAEQLTAIITGNNKDISIFFKNFSAKTVVPPHRLYKYYSLGYLKKAKKMGSPTNEQEEQKQWESKSKPASPTNQLSNLANSFTAFLDKTFPRY